MFNLWVICFAVIFGGIAVNGAPHVSNHDRISPLFKVLNSSQAINLCLKLGPEFDEKTCSEMFDVFEAIIREFVDSYKLEDTVCTWCTDAATDVQRAITGNQTEMRFRQALNQICFVVGLILGDDQRRQCLDTVASNVDAIFQFLRQKIHLKSLCNRIGCQSDDAMIGETGNPTKLALAGSDEYEIHLLNDEQPSSVQYRPIESHVGESMECYACKQMMHWVMSELTEKSTETEIIAALDEVCGYLGSFKSQCDDIVNEYGDALVTLIAKNVSPQGICAEIDVCQATGRNYQDDEVETHLVNVESHYACSACEQMMDFATDAWTQKLSNGTSLVQMVDEKVCSLTQSKLSRHLCHIIVKQYGRTFLRLMHAKVMNKETVCDEYFKVCPENSLQSATSHLGKDDYRKWMSGEACDICLYGVTSLDNYMKKPGFQMEAVRYVKLLCGSLPTSMRDDCIASVDNYLPILINSVATLVNDKAVCSDLKMCSKLNGEVTDMLCSGCLDAVQMLENMLQSQEVQANIASTLLIVCDFLPGSWETECTSLIKENLPDFIAMVIQMLTPEEVCEKTMLCTGEKQCTWGPGYWCQNTDNAEECQAMNWCETHIWHNNTDLVTSAANSVVKFYGPIQVFAHDIGDNLIPNVI